MCSEYGIFVVDEADLECHGMGYTADPNGLSDNPEDKEKTFIIIAKHRNGETKDIPMLFKGEKVRFMEMDSALDMQAAGMTTESRMNSEFGESDFENAAY